MQSQGASSDDVGYVCHARMGRCILDEPRHFGLVGAEFLPVSLLTPIAHDLQATEGMAGQAVTVTAAVTLVTSLLVTVVRSRFDHRNVLIFFSALLIASNLMVAAAPNLTSLLLANMR